MFAFVKKKKKKNMDAKLNAEFLVMNVQILTKVSQKHNV